MFDTLAVRRTAFSNLPRPDVFLQDDEVVGFGDGFVFDYGLVNHR